MLVFWFWQEVKMTFDPCCPHNLRLTWGFCFTSYPLEFLHSSGDSLTSCCKLEGGDFYTRALLPALLGKIPRQGILEGKLDWGSGREPRVTVLQELWVLRRNRNAWLLQSCLELSVSTIQEDKANYIPVAAWPEVLEERHHGGSVCLPKSMFWELSVQCKSIGSQRESLEHRALTLSVD